MQQQAISHSTPQSQASHPAMHLGLFPRLSCLFHFPVPLVSMSSKWEISMPTHAAPAENPAMQAQQGASPLVMLLAPALHEEIAAFVLLPEDKAALRASCRYRYCLA